MRVPDAYPLFHGQYLPLCKINDLEELPGASSAIVNPLTPEAIRNLPSRRAILSPECLGGF